jgi:hypothetical protein
MEGVVNAALDSRLTYLMLRLTRGAQVQRGR